MRSQPAIVDAGAVARHWGVCCIARLGGRGGGNVHLHGWKKVKFYILDEHRPPKTPPRLSPKGDRRNILAH